MVLRPEIAAPTHIARLTAIGLAATGAGLFAIARPALEAPRQQGTATIAIATEPEITFDVPPIASQVEAPPASRMASRSVAMVFTAAGASWMKLENLALPGATTDMDGVPRSAWPTHGKIEHTREDWVETATAPIALEDVPAAHRERLGSAVIVDGTCTAHITGFAIVARLTGDTGYAGDDTGAEWTGRSVMRYGSPMIAAKLDGCSGALARDATLPPAAKALTIDVADAKLVAQARRMLVRTKAARAATEEWRAHFGDQAPPTSWAASEATEWKTQMFVHPTTHQTWISVHANQLESCGTPHINVWGLYRVEKDGTLTGFDVSLGAIETIDGLVDFDGDGMVEVVGKAWLGEILVNDTKGATLEKLELPFYGCPC